jgi:hypothetical protein
MKAKSLVSLGLLMGLVGGTASAVPAIDSPFGMRLSMGSGELQDASPFDPRILAHTVFTGSAVDGDEHVIYYPYSKLEIVKDSNGVPKFAFSYGRKGAMFTATLRATADIEGTSAVVKAVRASMEANGVAKSRIKIAPLPVHRGTYRSTLAMKDGSAEWVIATTEVSNAIPTNEVAVSAVMGRAAADLVVTSLQSPYTVMGWNYTYDFPGRTTPYRASITLNWESIYDYTRHQFGFKTIVTSVDVEKAVRKLRERKAIDIKIVGGDNDQDVNKAIMDVVRIVLARTFKAHHPEPQARNLDIPKPNNSGFSSMALGYGSNAGLPNVPVAGWLTSVSAGYSLVEMKSEERVEEQITLTSNPYKVFTATAGVQIPGGCDAYAKHFAYAAERADANGNYPILQGCPTAIYGEVPPVAQQVGQNGNAASFGGSTVGNPAASTDPSESSALTDAIANAAGLN